MLEDAGTTEGMLLQREGRSHLQQRSVRCTAQGPAYNRHTLPGETEPVEHAKEILILRHKSLRVEVSGGDGVSSRKEVRGSGEGLDLQRPCTGCFPVQV